MSHRWWSLLRVSWLAIAVALLSPISPLLLVGVPLALLLLAFRPSDLLSLGLAAAILVLSFGGFPGSARPMWLAERAWSLLIGGAFVGVSVLWGRRGLLFRSTTAVAVAASMVAALAIVRPSRLAELDWWMTSEIHHAATLAYTAVSSIVGAEPWLERFGTVMYEWVGFQQAVYPAFLALASLAALGVAWFVASRLRGGQPAIGELREFRFSDHLVWVLVAGMVLLVAPAGQLAFRLGENATLFMGALYLLRGIAVLVWVAATFISSAWTAALWALLALLFYPIVGGTALVLGLSDTWLDLRSRLRRGGFANGR